MRLSLSISAAGRLLALVITLSFANSGRAQAIDLLPEQLHKTISDKIRFALFGTQTGGFLRIAPTDLLEDFNASNPSIQQAVDAIGADVLQCHSSQLGLTNAFGEILEKASWAKSLLNNNDMAALAAVRKEIFATDGTTPIPAFANYLKLKQIYDDAKADLDRTPIGQQTASQKNRLKKADGDLQILGQSATFRPLESKLATLTARQTNNRASQYRQRWPVGGAAEARKTISFLPPLGELDDDSHWIQFTFDDTIDGLPDWVGSELHISFKTVRLTVVRPWFSADAFTDDSWNYPVMVADGEGNGLIGKYVGALLLIKDVSIGIKSSSAVKSALRSALSLDDSVEFGPITVATRAPGAAPFVANVNRATKTMRVDGPLLFGCQGILLPKSPNPNGDYQWQ